MYMRWMLIGLMVSLIALLLVAGGIWRHVLRHRRVRGTQVAAAETVLELGSKAQGEATID